MKSFIFIIILVCITANSNALESNCNAESWRSAHAHYGKEVGAFNKYIDLFNAAIYEINAFEFVHERYTLQEVTLLWAQEKEWLNASLSDKHQITTDRIEELNQLKKDVERVKLSLINSESLWGEIAESCRERGEYTSSHQASENITIATALFNSTTNMITRIDELRSVYTKDKQLIEDGYEQYSDRFGD